MSKYIFLRSVLLSVLITGLVPTVARADPILTSDLDPITVYKSPTCGCCKKWVSHLTDNGFKVRAIDSRDMNGIKIKAGVPFQLASCHTAVIGGYIIEGHVPAGDIKRLLEERPDIAGLSVPRMPMGSPGMEGHRKDRYDVLTFTATGDTTVFSRY